MGDPIWGMSLFALNGAFCGRPYGVCCCLPFFVYNFSAKGKNCWKQLGGLTRGIYWDLSPMCLQQLWSDRSSPWPLRYGIVSVGRLGQMSLFLPF